MSTLLGQIRVGESLDARLEDNNWRILRALIEGLVLTARAPQTSNVAITTSGELAITGATITVTPLVATRLVVFANFRLICDVWTSITGAIRGLLRVNGTTVSTPFTDWRAPVANAVNNISHTWTVDVAANTATTLELRTNLAGTADNDYTVLADGTGLTVLAIPL